MPYKKLTHLDIDKNLHIKNNINLPGVIMCHQKSCSHCVTTMPILKELSKNNNLVVYSAECSGKNFDILDLLEISYVPHIRYVSPDGRIYKTPYKGKMTKTELKKYIFSKIKKK